MKLNFIFLFLLLTFFENSYGGVTRKFVADEPIPNAIEERNDDCVLPDGVAENIASYRDVVENIITEFTNKTYKGEVYKRLAYFVDKFGSRLSGTKNLENAIDYMINETLKNFPGVKTENVIVPRWLRGEEYAKLIEPREKDIKIAGLGFSVATASSGSITPIVAPVIVVKSFDELDSLDEVQVRGKIVVYDEEFTTYGSTVAYRSKGASKASKKGAVAALVRSIGSFHIGLPHTGMQSYEGGITPIPVAAITLADADQLKRMYDRGEKIVIELKMSATLSHTSSRNTIVELKGTKEPEKHLITSGHIDSWDKGEGAMDDGAGMMISWFTPIVLKKLNLIPKRSIRAILWTSEELGLVGAADYKLNHEFEKDNLIFTMESDIGVFNPLGVSYSGSKVGECVMKEIVKLFDSINATEVEVLDNVGSDIELFTEEGYPGAELKSTNEKYFWFHHSDADNMNVLDPIELDKSAALWTSLAYVLADMDFVIPKETKKV